MGLFKQKPINGNLTIKMLHSEGLPCPAKVPYNLVLDEAERNGHTGVIRKFPSLLIDYEGVNYEVVLLDDFLRAVPKDRVVGKRVFN